MGKKKLILFKKLPIHFFPLSLSAMFRQKLCVGASDTPKLKGCLIKPEHTQNKNGKKHYQLKCIIQVHL